MTDELCPHCGSEDYGSLGDYLASVCLTCGYDTDHGDLGVCPGGKHPRDRGELCCDPCWARAPRNLPEHPLWRSRLRSARARGRRSNFAWVEVEQIHNALIEWLRANPLTP